MIKFTARKMFRGKVSIRSYIVEYAKQMREDIRLVYNNKYMIVTPKTPYTCDERLHKAEKDDQYISKDSYYRLYDYIFIPKEPTAAEQTWSGLKQIGECLGKALGKIKETEQKKLI